MVTIGIHEYFRIFVPAMLVVILVKVLMPDQLPNDIIYLMLLSASFGLLFTPITDRLSNMWFHRQILKTKFYETFIEHFSKYYKISLNLKSNNQLISFSGKLQIPESAETKCIMEAYKIFSRQGWGSAEETYRVRTEKSFGILYFTLFCYLFVILTFYLSYMLIGRNQIRTILGHSYLDIILLIILMSVSFWESTARFRKSLKNELLVLEAHLKMLKTYYDELINSEG